MRLVVCALSISSFVACSDPAGSGGDAGMPDAPVLTGDMYRVTWGPVTIPPGVEDTQCIWLRLGNTGPIKVHQMHNQLNDASHHLIVYKNDQDTTEQTTPTPCDPFTGALNTSGMIAPIAITQKADDKIFLPPRVAYTFAPDQMIKLEMHYVNRGDEPKTVMATADFYAADAANIDHEASIIFAGSPDIDIPAGQTVTLHQFFTVPSYLNLSQSKFFAITGHTHKLGTSVRVSVAPGKTGPFTEVYAPTPFRWDEPETTPQSPEFSIPVGGGIDFECTWTNTTNRKAGFGESADDEMCFFWMYYYPSQGSKVCVHTEQYGGANGLNVCCPGDSLCGLIESWF
jgi:hypothetical protein